MTSGAWRHRGRVPMAGETSLCDRGLRIRWWWWWRRPGTAYTQRGLRHAYSTSLPQAAQSCWSRHPLPAPTIRTATRATVWSGFPAARSAWAPTSTIRKRRRSIASTVDAFWIDRTPVTNRQFKAFVSATGHVTFAEIAPDPKDYPGALPHMLYAGSLVFTPPGAAGRSARLEPVVVLPEGRRLAASLRSQEQHQRAATIIPSCMSRSPMRVAYAQMGRQGPADRSASGSSPRAAASTAPSSPGATSSRPAACTWPIPGRANSRAQNLCDDGLRAHLARDGVSAQRLRRPRHDRQCLGMDHRLVLAKARPPMRRRRAAFRRTRAAGAKTRATTRRQPSIKIPRKVIKGGSHLCAPNYCRRYRPAARHAAAGRYVDQPCRIPLRHRRQERRMSNSSRTRDKARRRLNAERHRTSKPARPCC